ncbi:hypothetical protein [Vulcanisaeta sp. EB80]|uniref:hypothetical protein n=1 Tax=Vulcanisaeta sp. EB80 TaxID=1650660 RepID=UPI001180E117|nr:hypothetical protein [Vulcanisaeta sp. EB80]
MEGYSDFSQELKNQTQDVNTLVSEFLKEVSKRSSAQSFEVEDDGIYRGDKMVMPVVVEDVQVIDDVDGIRYIVRLRSTVPSIELTCEGDLDEVYECVKRQVPVLNSHIARNALMHAIYTWLDKHGARQTEQTTAMDKFLKLINEILAVAQLTYSRLKKSTQETPFKPEELYDRIAENPLVLEAIQKVAYGARVTTDKLLCIPIETLRNKGINVEELEAMSISYQELIEVIKTQEFKTALELLGLDLQENQAELTIQKLTNALSKLSTKDLEPIINNQDNIAKAIKALKSLAPIKQRIRTPQGRTPWALCLKPPTTETTEDTENTQPQGDINAK